MEAVVQAIGIVNSAWTLVLTVAAVLLAVLAGRVSVFERFFVLAPLRRAAAVLRREERRGPRRQRGAVRTIARELRRVGVAVLAGEGLSSAEIVRRFVVHSDSDVELRRAVIVHRLAKTAAAPGRRGLIAGFAWSQQSSLVADHHAMLADYVHRMFLGKSTLDLTGQGRSERSRAFARVVSAFSGALILADGMPSRARVLHRIDVLLDAGWDGPDEPHERRASPVADAGVGSRWSLEPGAYERRHRDRDVAKLAGGQKVLSPGDYDGRIVSVRSVETRIDSASGQLVATIRGRDSCYVVSERAEGYACKHLPPGTPAPPFTLREHRARFDRPDEHLPSMLLNVVLGLIARDEQGSRCLVLTRRGNRANNGHDVISTSAGGVLDSPRPGAVHGDADEWGAPSPLHAVIRETREELGVELAPDAVAPVAVFASNIVGRVRASGREGELVASACYLAETSQTLTALTERMAAASDWTLGRFESEGLDHLPLPEVDENSEAARGEAARRFLDVLEARMTHIDQSAVICALYAAAHLYGPENVIEAIRKSGIDAWWTRAWSGEDASRAVCPPADLLSAERGRAPEWIWDQLLGAPPEGRRRRR